MTAAQVSTSNNTTVQQEKCSSVSKMAEVLMFTFPVGLGLDDLTDAPWPHCILGGEGELVPGAALEGLQAVGPLAGADGVVPPLLTVVLRVLEDVAWDHGGKPHTHTVRVLPSIKLRCPWSHRQLSPGVI